MMNGFERYTKKTRRALFLEEMEQVCRGQAMWADRALLPQGRQRTPAGGVERMLRIYFLQQWFNLSTRQWKKRCTIRR